ncbi:MAG: hydrolase [Flavipsychrobacter sp.]|nr:hydrolase [Flavipsychrobacter sp.]
MSFTRKIYFNDKPLILTTDKASYIRDNPGAEAYISYSAATRDNYKQAVVEMGESYVKGVIVEDGSEEVLSDTLQRMYRPIDAGGGIAYNEQGAILMIYRRGKWDLPKGKLDAGENIEDCSLREVKEETGLEQLALGEKICDTYHIYTLRSEQMLKRTAWYKMKGTSADKLKPQKEENILEARWVKEEELPPLAAKSYEAIREVLRAAGLLVN